MIATETAVRNVKFYVDGKWDDAAGAMHPVYNPATGKVIAQVPYATVADIDRAVRAAHAAYLKWREVPVVDRVQVFYRYKELLEKHADEIARIRKVSGYVGCLAPSPSVGSGALFLANNQILTTAHIFFEESGTGGAPDGMKVDERGNVYCTGPGGIWVISAAGEHLGVISVPEATANMNWGDSDWRTLYVTASRSIYRVRMKVAGNRVPYMG